MAIAGEVGFVQFATTGELVHANEALARCLGFASPAALVEAARQTSLIRWTQTSTPPWDRHSLPNAPVAIEAECTRRDGSSSAYLMVLLPARAPHGAPAYVDALLLDVAQRANSDHRDERGLFDSLLKALPNPIFVKDNEHRWVILNDSYCTFMGYPRAELLGKSDYDFFPEDEADVFWAKDDVVFREGGIVENEEGFTDANGRKHVILTRKALHTDASGRRLLLGVITDISERKQVEEQLRESEERFRHLADSLPQIVWIADTDGAVQHFNRKWWEYTGLPQHRQEGSEWQEQLHPSDRSEYIALMRRAVASGSAFEAEFRLRRHDGEYRWHLGRALPVRGPAGQVLQWFGTTTDIEDQKRQQQVLKESDRRKNDFLALLGHELRNPLNPISIAVSLLRQSNTYDAKLRRAHEIIERQVKQMARLVEDLLDLSRVSRGKILLRKEHFDVVDLVRTVVADRFEGLQAHGLGVETRLPCSPIIVFGDPARIAQAIGNLLDNAEKFTDPGGTITVTVECARERRGVEITVSDTGIGMSRETLAHVFEPFVQAKRSVGRGRGGLGLGLSLVKGLAELHHGAVRASSEGEGRGSRITVWLPVPEREADSVADCAAPELGAPAARRILVIEDNPDAAAILDLALSASGHDVVVALTGEEGLARARGLRPDIVFSDIGLPGMSGYDVARALRQNDEFASTCLVAITGYGQDEDQRRARDAGFDRHLTKPIDADSLALLLATLPQRRSA